MAQKDGLLFPARGARSDPAPGPGAPRFVQQEAEIILSLLFIKFAPIIRERRDFVNPCPPGTSTVTERRTETWQGAGSAKKFFCPLFF